MCLDTTTHAFPSRYTATGIHRHGRRRSVSPPRRHLPPRPGHSRAQRAGGVCRGRRCAEPPQPSPSREAAPVPNAARLATWACLRWRGHFIFLIYPWHTAAGPPRVGSPRSNFCWMVSPCAGTVANLLLPHRRRRLQRGVRASAASPRVRHGRRHARPGRGQQPQRHHAQYMQTALNRLERPRRGATDHVQEEWNAAATMTEGDGKTGR